MARVYDFWLGGKDNYAADRELAFAIATLAPEVPYAARANRGFMVGIVRDLAAQGFDQFLDLGSGMPTSPNVHEAAKWAAPSARAVYVDSDEIVAVHARANLSGSPGVAVVHADIRTPPAVLGDPRLLGVLDLSRPVVVLMLAVLHFVSDHEDPAGLIKAYADQLAPGSVVVVSHATTLAEIDPWSNDRSRRRPKVPRVSGASAALLRHAQEEGEGPRGELEDAPGPNTPDDEDVPEPVGPPEVDERMREAAALYSRHAVPITLRSVSEVRAMMGGLVLDPPGVVPAHAWWTDGRSDADATVLVAVGRVP